MPRGGARCWSTSPLYGIPPPRSPSFRKPTHCFGVSMSFWTVWPRLSRRGGTARGEAAPAGSALLDDLAEARARYEGLLLQFMQRQPTAAAAVGARPLPPREIRASLERDEALVEYLVLPDRVVIFVVLPEAIRVRTTRIAREQLASRVRLARDLLQHSGRAPEELWPVLESLHSLLLQPVREVIGTRRLRRLTLVPQGTLSYLPFAALRDPATERFLSRDFALRILPNAGALALPPSGQGMRNGVAAFAPFPERLPATMAEAGMFPSLDPPGSASVGPAATETAVRRALADGRPVHIASHAVMNARNPMFSRIRTGLGGAGLASGWAPRGPRAGCAAQHVTARLPVRMRDGRRRRLVHRLRCPGRLRHTCPSLPL